MVNTSVDSLNLLQNFNLVSYRKFYVPSNLGNGDFKCWRILIWNAILTFHQRRRKFDFPTLPESGGKRNWYCRVQREIYVRTLKSSPKKYLTYGNFIEISFSRISGNYCSDRVRCCTIRIMFAFYIRMSFRRFLIYKVTLTVFKCPTFGKAIEVVVN